MRMLKRVVWFCYAGCCCAGLMLVGGERFQSTTSEASGNSAYANASYCPNAFYGQYGGVYYYRAIVSGSDCMSPMYFGVTDTRLHQTSDCGTCPDPITGAAMQPMEIDPAEFSPTPQPDPLFSGILR